MTVEDPLFITTGLGTYILKSILKYAWTLQAQVLCTYTSLDPTVAPFRCLPVQGPKH